MQIISILSHGIIQKTFSGNFHATSENPNFSVDHGSGVSASAFRNASVGFHAAPRETH
jgi:hypothetical protein